MSDIKKLLSRNIENTTAPFSPQLSQFRWGIDYNHFNVKQQQQQSQQCNLFSPPALLQYMYNRPQIRGNSYSQAPYNHVRPWLRFLITDKILFVTYRTAQCTTYTQIARAAHAQHKQISRTAHAQHKQIYRTEHTQHKTGFQNCACATSADVQPLREVYSPMIFLYSSDFAFFSIVLRSLSYRIWYRCCSYLKHQK